MEDELDFQAADARFAGSFDPQLFEQDEFYVSGPYGENLVRARDWNKGAQETNECNRATLIGNAPRCLMFERIIVPNPSERQAGGIFVIGCTGVRCGSKVTSSCTINGKDIPCCSHHAITCDEGNNRFVNEIDEADIVFSDSYFMKDTDLPPPVDISEM